LAGSRAEHHLNWEIIRQVAKSLKGPDGKALQRGNQDVQSPRGNQGVQSPRGNQNVQSPPAR
jgi:hypothetical protein